MSRLVRWTFLGAVAVGAGVALVRRLGAHASGRHAPGGILIGDVAGYDTHTRLLFGSLYRGIASDIAAAAPSTARILEVGCGPGHLSIRLARVHELDVTGLDLDPEMIERAQTNAERSAPHGPRPTFVVGDVAAMPFGDGPFDMVISTFSMHHWSDPKAGLNEIARVLRPDGRALIWDLKPGFRLLHAQVPDPAALVQTSDLRLLDATAWRWPWRLTIARRLDLTRG